jgi:hypothetical protein
MATTETARSASVARKTNETDISVSLSVDGNGTGSISTGIGFFDHMLEQLARHSLIDMRSRPRAICTSTITTRWRTPASRSARRWRRRSATASGITRYASSISPWTKR